MTMIMYSVPMDASGDTSGHRFNRVRSPLGRNYARMRDSLWFPPYTIDNPGQLINPYDSANNIEVPRAFGGTCFSMGLMLAYNQYSGNPALQTYNPSPAPLGDAGGLGRRGAQKIVLFETDGVPNNTASANLTNVGPYQSYYNIRYNSTSPGTSEFPNVGRTPDNDPTVTSEIYNLTSQLCALESASPPGYATPGKKVLVHCIGFGPVFNATSPVRNQALATLQQIQYIGGTQANPSDPLPAYKIVTGSDSDVVSNLRAAIREIFESSVTVSLIE
jgi:hypothetical protein